MLLFSLSQTPCPGLSLRGDEQTEMSQSKRRKHHQNPQSPTDGIGRVNLAANGQNQPSHLHPPLPPRNQGPHPIGWARKIWETPWKLLVLKSSAPGNATVCKHGSCRLLSRPPNPPFPGSPLPQPVFPERYCWDPRESTGREANIPPRGPAL